MSRSKSLYRKQVFAEVETVPEEYLPYLLQLIRTYRESMDLKPAAESFQKGWQESQAAEAIPVKHLWEGIDGE
jgi:hypothetical protein